MEKRVQFAFEEIQSKESTILHLREDIQAIEAKSRESIQLLAHQIALHEVEFAKREGYLKTVIAEKNEALSTEQKLAKTLSLERDAVQETLEAIRHEAVTHLGQIQLLQNRAATAE